MEVIKQVLENHSFKKNFQKLKEDLLVCNFSPDSSFLFHEQALRWEFPT